MIIPGISTAMALLEETTAPYDLSILCKEELRLQLNEFPAVDRVSPVRRVQAQLSVEDYSQSIEIQGVFSSFLDLEFIAGGRFQDDTYMPFLVMNEAAAKGFTQKESEEPHKVDINTVLIMKGLGEEREVRITGIFRDGLETPVCYMSFSTASRNQEQPERLEYLLHLPHKGDAAKTANLLVKRHLNVQLDQNELQRWDLMKSQIWQYLITAATGLCCGYVMIWKQHTNDEEQEKEEYMGLLSCGFTKNELSRIVPIRIYILTAGCVLFAISIFMMYRCVN